MDCESTGYRVHLIDRNHYFSRLQAFLLCGNVSVLEAVGIAVFHNKPSFRMSLQASLDSVIIAVTSHSVKFIVYKDCYQFRTSPLTYVPGGAPNPSGHSLPLLCPASRSALALVHVLSVARLGPVSSILQSFAGEASPAVDLLALRSHLLLKFYRRPTLQLVEILRTLS